MTGPQFRRIPHSPKHGGLRMAFDFKPLLSGHARRAVRAGSMVAAFSTPNVRANLLVGQPAVEALPIEEMVEAARKALPGNPKALLYGRRQGAPELIDAVRAKLRVFEGLELAADRFFISNGSGQAIDLILRAFVEPGQPIALDDFSFGANLVSDITDNAHHIAWDASGPDVEALDRLAANPTTKPRVFYTVPTFQNPMGHTMSLDRRRSILEVCARHGIPILEDDAYYELRFEGERLPSMFELDGGTGLVTRTGTFSKILGAGIRLGWASTSPAMAEHLANMKPDGGTSPFSSAIASVFMRDHMTTQIPRLQTLYRAKRDVMLDELDEVLTSHATWSRPQGGFFVWVTLRRPEIADRVVARCAELGVLVRSGAAFRVDRQHRGGIRLCYSQASEAEIRDGVQVLAEVVGEIAA